MENNENTIKCCATCMYYRRHYVKTFAYYAPTICGHCLKGKVAQKLMAAPSNYFCGKWEPLAIQKRELNESLYVLLRDIAKALQDISEILEESQ